MARRVGCSALSQVQFQTPVPGTGAGAAAAPRAAPAARSRAAPTAGPQAAPVAGPRPGPAEIRQAAPIASRQAAQVANRRAAPAVGSGAAPVAAPMARRVGSSAARSSWVFTCRSDRAVTYTGPCRRGSTDTIGESTAVRPAPWVRFELILLPSPGRRQAGAGYWDHRHGRRPPGRRERGTQPLSRRPVTGPHRTPATSHRPRRTPGSRSPAHAALPTAGHRPTSRF
jgi:hypothetical protein